MAASIISVLTATSAVLSTPVMLSTTTALTSIGGTSPTTTTTQASSAVTSSPSLHTPTVHFITVGAAEELAFEPPFVDATVGDIVSFTFHALNHSLTESSLDDPCNALPGGFSTGFHQYNAADDSTMEVAFTVNSPAPQYFFCAQSEPVPHCDLGMVFAINAGSSFAPFVANALQIGPFSTLITSLVAETVTFDMGNTQTTETFSNVDVPTVILGSPAISMTTVLLPVSPFATPMAGSTTPMTSVGSTTPVTSVGSTTPVTSALSTTPVTSIISEVTSTPSSTTTTDPSLSTMTSVLAADSVMTSPGTSLVVAPVSVTNVPITSPVSSLAKRVDVLATSESRSLHSGSWYQPVAALLLISLVASMVL